MEYLSQEVGWKTFLLVQFYTLYKTVLLIGICYTVYLITSDLAYAYSNNMHISTADSERLLWGIDCLCGIDIVSMFIYKLVDWQEAKQIYPPRHYIILVLDFIALLPCCLFYSKITGKQDVVFLVLRSRYILRAIRIVTHVKETSSNVGLFPILKSTIEIILILGIGLVLFAYVIYLLVVKEGFVIEGYKYMLYYTNTITSGIGIVMDEDVPNKGMFYLLFATFTIFIIKTYYTSRYVVDFMQGMKGGFLYVHSSSTIKRVMAHWKLNNPNIENAINKFSYETWINRNTLNRTEQFTNIIPDVIQKELILDLCWDAFKHSHLFRNMEVNYLRYLSSIMELRYVTSGELIYKKGKCISNMIYVRSGVIQILSDEDGETPILSLSGGTCLGETTLFIDHPSSCTIVANTYAELCVLERKNFLHSFQLYPTEYLKLLKVTQKRFQEARHYFKINQFQILKYTGDKSGTRNQIVTMKWLKKSLYRLLGKENESNFRVVLSSNLEDRRLENIFSQVIFCCRYLDLLVIASEYELQGNFILLKSTWPIIFQPDSIVIKLWKRLVFLLTIAYCATYIFYVGFSEDVWGMYAIFVYIVTTVYCIDIYLLCCTAIKTRDMIETKISSIIAQRLMSSAFIIDLVSALPLEFLIYMMTGKLRVQSLHLLQVNRCAKIITSMKAFDISGHTDTNVIILFKYVKFIFIFTMLLCNIAGIFYLMMCPNFNCTLEFREFIEKKDVNYHDTSKVVMLCVYMSIQFIAGFMIDDFPINEYTCFIFFQLVFFIAEMLFFAELAACRTLINRIVLNYHEFINNVKITMNEWNFSKFDKERILRYCESQWAYDRGLNLLYNERLLKNLPPDLSKIAKHVAFAPVIGNIPIFKDLPNDITSNICKFAVSDLYPPGEVVIYTGEVCKEMHAIEQGYCAVLLPDNKKKILGPGDSFSVVEAFMGISTVNTVITLTYCKLIYITSEGLAQAMRYSPNISNEIKITVNTMINLKQIEEMVERNSFEVTLPSIKDANFFKFGYCIKDAKLRKEYDASFWKIMFPLKFLLMRYTIIPTGKFMLYWEGMRSLFAILTIALHIVTPFCCMDLYLPIYFNRVLIATAFLDIYVRHHVAYYNKDNILIVHPLYTAYYYWSHGFLIDFLGTFTFSNALSIIKGHTITPTTDVNLRMFRILQYFRAYNFFSHMVKSTGHKIWVLFKYSSLVFVVFCVTFSIVINQICDFNTTYNYNHIIIGAECDKNSWIYRHNEQNTFYLPVQPSRLYAYGMLFLSSIMTFKTIESFEVNMYKECIQVTIIAIIFFMFYMFVCSGMISDLMYRNVSLVSYQTAMNSLVKFMSYRKIDPVLTTEIIEHFEYVWRKTKGNNEKEMFQTFSKALQADALYHIYGSALRNSLILSNASISLIKSILLHCKHTIVIKRGFVTRVHDVHNMVYFLFRGTVAILGPDYHLVDLLYPGSMFGQLDENRYCRQTLSFVAQGHIEILSLPASIFFSILSTHRSVYLSYKTMTRLNVDFLKHKVEPSSADENKENIETVQKYTFNLFKNVPAAFKRICKVHHRNKYIKAWEIVSLFVCCFFGILVEIYQSHTLDTSTFMFVILYVNDILFIIRIFLLFHTAYEDDRGLWVTDKQLIARRYIKDRCGFILSVITTIPIEIFCFAFSGKYRWAVWSYLRLPHVMRICILLKYFKEMKNKLNINVFWMHAIFMIVCSVFLMQIGCAILFRVAMVDVTLEHFNVEEFTNGQSQMYMRHLRVFVNMFTGARVFNFSPNHGVITLITTVLYVTTRFIFAYFVAGVCSTLQTVFHNKIGYEMQITTLKRTMSREQVSAPLQVRVWWYVCRLWLHHKGIQFPILLEKAPLYLREGVLNSMFGSHIRNHPLLKKCHSELIRQMATNMYTQIFFCGDYITYIGDIDETMYFIHEGEVDVVSEDTMYSEEIEGTLKTGEMFGLEQGMYKRCGHDFSYRAKSHCLIVTLQRKNWIHLLDFFPASKHLVYDKHFQKKSEKMKQKRKEIRQETKRKKATLKNPRSVYKAGKKNTKKKDRRSTRFMT